MVSHEQYSGIIEGLRDVAGKFGDKAAVGGIDRSYSTHTQLIEQIDQTAEKLRSAQIKSGDLVIVALDEGPEFLTAILSVMSAAIPLPLNPSIPAQEAEYFFAELPIAAIIVTERAGSALVMAAEASGVSILRLVTDQQRPAGQFDLLLTRYTRPPEQQIDNPMQTALLSTSSGTTGTPKIIAHTHASMVTNCISFADQARLTNEDRSLCVVPFALLHSLWRSCLPVLLRGGQVVCASGFDARRALDQIDDVRPTFMTAVPSIYLLLLKRIAETGWSPDGCSIRALFCGSDAINRETIEAVESAFQAPLRQWYGMGEVSPMLAFCPLPPADIPSNAVGKVVSPWDVRILGEDGKKVPKNVEGEIVATGGLIHPRLETEAQKGNPSIVGDWYHTRDLGYLDGDGFLYVTGRVDDRINRGGKKVYPKEIESAFLTHEAVAQAVVFGLPDELYGERIGALVVLAHGHTETEDKLRAYVGARVADYKMPEYIKIVESIPLNQMGKISRKTLAGELEIDNVMAQRRLARSHVKPATKTEKQLMFIFEELFEKVNISTTDDFFALGGDSLSSLKLLLAIEETFAIKATPAELFHQPTVQALAALIEDRRTYEPMHPAPREDPQIKEALVPIKKGGDGVPLFLVLAGMNPPSAYLSLSRHLAPERPVYALRPLSKKDVPILQTRIDDIVSHYIERILDVWPGGPFLVGGFCDGGIFAFELGQRLQEMGHEVIFVGLIDTIDYEAKRRDDAEDVRIVEGRRRHLRYCRILEKGQKPSKRLSSKIDVEMVLRLAKEGYSPKVFEGQLTLFRALDEAKWDIPQRVKIDDPNFGWQRRSTKGLDVHDLPGTHLGILREPHVKKLGALMETSITAALKTYGAS